MAQPATELIIYRNFDTLTEEEISNYVLTPGTATYRRISARGVDEDPPGPPPPGGAGASPGFGMGVPSVPTSLNYMLGTPLRKWKAVWAEVPVIQTSDARNKHHVTDSELGLDFVMSLRPVSFRLRVEPKGGRHYGFIGQEMKKALKGRSFAGLVDTEAGMGVMYSELISPLVKALQEQQAQIDDLKDQVRKLRG